MIQRKNTKNINVGGILIGGDSPISVQSMATTKTSDVARTVQQISRLSDAGCDIVRVAVPDEASARAIFEIKKQIKIPLVADIHFDHNLAILSAEAGADKIRINPGNIGGEDRVAAVVSVARKKNIPIRIGVNGGSMDKDIVEKHGHTPQAMVESAMRHVAILNKFDFDDIAISIKASDVATTVQATRLMAQRCNYPLHLGVTESGTSYIGIIKSSVGIGALLLDGIGDTIRVSLTADLVEEVRAGIALLKSVGIRGGVEIISCPTCARCNIDLIELAQKVTTALAGCEKNIKVAVMGCAVNGPGEARGADVGVAGGNGVGLIFKKGEIVRRVAENEILDNLLQEIDAL